MTFLKKNTLSCKIAPIFGHIEQLCVPFRNSSNEAAQASIFLYLSDFDHLAIIGIRFSIAFGLDIGVISQRHVDNPAFARLVWADPFRLAPHLDLLGDVLRDKLQPFHLLL